MYIPTHNVQVYFTQSLRIIFSQATPRSAHDLQTILYTIKVHDIEQTRQCKFLDIFPYAYLYIIYNYTYIFFRWSRSIATRSAT